jgi:hypothetical protein
MLYLSLLLLVFIAVLNAESTKNRIKRLPSLVSPPLPPTSLPNNSIRLPLMRQSTFYTCGVASLQSCLYYWQVYDSTEEVLALECGTTEENGTPPENIVRVAQSYNVTAFMRENNTLDDLEAAIHRGYTVILDVQAWTGSAADDYYGDPPVDWRNDWEDGHYVVLVGMDEKYVFIMDPSTGGTYAYVPRDEFLDRWHDYSTLVDGTRKEYIHMAIFIHGQDPLPYPPMITYMG